VKKLDLSAFRAATNGVEVGWQGEDVSVVGINQPWAYAARADLDHQQVSGDIRIELKLSVLSGNVRAGVLAADEGSFITEVAIPPSCETTVSLDVGRAVDASSVVIRSDESCDEIPRFLIHDMSVGARETQPEYPHVTPLKVHSLVDNLWPLPLEKYGVEVLRHWSEADVEAQMTGNRMHDNLVLNKWEFTHGKTVLKSYPWRLSVPFVLCNARCEFCAAWQMKGKAPLLDLMQSLTPVIQRCKEIDLVGWGEPLIHPEFAQILELLRDEADTNARIALTTNGVRLEEWIDRLLEANVMDFAISVHATNTKTHQDLMGFHEGDFDRVIAGVKQLVERRKRFPRMTIEMVMVVTQQNLAEIPDFIEMCEDLDVQKVFLRTLMPMEAPREGLDYHRLLPYRHPDFQALRFQAVMAIQGSDLEIKASPETWSRPIFPPRYEAEIELMPVTPREERNTYFYSYDQDLELLTAGEPSAVAEVYELGANDYGRSAPLYCPSPYTAFYPNGFDRRVIPCVYMHKADGHEYIHFKPSLNFDQVWNSPAMVAVREHLNNGPLMSMCLKCPFFC
jgi:pyruvate-formate lyase-activating enzyme